MRSTICHFRQNRHNSLYCVGWANNVFVHKTPARCWARQSAPRPPLRATRRTGEGITGHRRDTGLGGSNDDPPGGRPTPDNYRQDEFVFIPHRGGTLKRANLAGIGRPGCLSFGRCVGRCVINVVERILDLRTMASSRRSCVAGVIIFMSINRCVVFYWIALSGWSPVIVSWVGGSTIGTIVLTLFEGLQYRSVTAGQQSNRLVNWSARRFIGRQMGRSDDWSVDGLVGRSVGCADPPVSSVSSSYGWSQWRGQDIGVAGQTI